MNKLTGLLAQLFVFFLEFSNSFIKFKFSWIRRSLNFAAHIAAKFVSMVKSYLCCNKHGVILVPYKKLQCLSHLFYVIDCDWLFIFFRWITTFSPSFIVCQVHIFNKSCDFLCDTWIFYKHEGSKVTLMELLLTLLFD